MKAAVVYVRGIAGVTLLIAHMGAAGRKSPQGDESVAGENRSPQWLLRLLNSAAYA